MISRIVGTILKKNTKTKAWWLKLGVSLILSNIFFFILFSSPSEQVVASTEITQGWVEAQFKAEMMTPYVHGKRVILLNRKKNLQIEARLQGDINPEGKYTAWIKDSEASTLFQFPEWEILPYLKNLKLPVIQKGFSHEIRY